MNFQEVPKLYQCYLTNKLMQDPVVFVPKGQIFDRTSLDQISGDKIEEKNVLPLPDLKAVIQQYQLLFCNTNQPEEISKTNQLKESPSSSSPGSSPSVLASIAQSYENKAKEVKNEAQVVSVAFEELQLQNKCLQTAFKNLKSKLENFNWFARELESIDVKKSIKDISQLTNRFIKNGINVRLAIHRECKLLSDLIVKKNYFEKQLTSLEKKEKELENLRQDLQNLFGNLEVQADFSTKFEASSKKYREAEQINQDEFAQLLKSGCVSNKSIHVKSQSACMDIAVQGQVHLNNLSFTNAQRGALYVKLLVNDSNTVINIENCQFSGIGLILLDDLHKQRGDIIVKNVQVKSAPEDGIYIGYLNKCDLLNIQIDTCGVTGISVGANESYMEDVHVLNCKHWGIFICELAKPMNMQNCSVGNCERYGLWNNSGFVVTGMNVAFENNGSGNVTGKFIQQ